jgi:hypothetical protein
VIKFDEINTTLRLFLDDNPEGGEAKYQFPLPMRIVGWNWAQSVFQNHTMREMTARLSIGEDKRHALLPADYLIMALVYDRSNERTYARRMFSEGGARNESGDNFAYWTWGGKLRFDRPVTEQIDIEYYAAWPKIIYTLNDQGKVTYVQGEVFVPEWAHLALAHLTAAAVLQPPAITAAMSNEYKIKIDSGTPLDNPREQQARAHAWWYNDLISRFPPQERVYGAS